jgi:hypothetical protein
LGHLSDALTLVGDVSRALLLLKNLASDGSLVEQVESGGDMVVSVGFYAFLGIVFFKAIVVDHAVEETLVHRHLLLSRVEALGFAFRDLLIPRVYPDIVNFESFIRIGLKNTLDHLLTVA